jgi:hypothetical protein
MEFVPKRIPPPAARAKKKSRSAGGLEGCVASAQRSGFPVRAAAGGCQSEFAAGLRRAPRPLASLCGALKRPDLE